MKIHIVLSTLMVLTLLSCSKDYGTSPLLETGENRAPAAFELIGISDNNTKNPVLTWRATTDPDGDPITYDIIAETEEGVSKVVAEDISDTSFEMDEVADTIGDNNWKVVAKDGKGGRIESKSISGCTMLVIFDNTPLTTRTPFSVADQDPNGYPGGIFTFDGEIYVSGADKRFWWKSRTDGTFWNQVELPKSLGENEAKLLTFKNKLWCISADGKIVWHWGGFEIYWSWEEGGLRQRTRAPGWRLISRTANFPPPFSSDDYKIVIFKDKIWSIRGTSIGKVGRAWQSSDMVNWTSRGLLFTLPYSADSTLTVFKGRIWQIGGFGSEYRWSSDDGIIWRREGQDFANRTTAYHSAVVYDNTLWVIGGWGDYGNSCPIWYSSDGNRWNLATPWGNKAPFSKRAWSSSVVFKNRVVVIGGLDWHDEEDTSIKTDVWTMRKCGSRTWPEL